MGWDGSSLGGVGACVCVEVLRPSQFNGVMSSAVILSNHTFNGQTLPPVLCTFFSQKRRERMTVENISSISTKECCQPGGCLIRNLQITSRTCTGVEWGRG